MLARGRSRCFPVRTFAFLPKPGAVTYRPFVLLPACSGLPPSSSSSSSCTSPSLASPDPCMACFLFLFPCFPAFTPFHSSARTHVPSPPSSCSHTLMTRLWRSDSVDLSRAIIQSRWKTDVQDPAGGLFARESSVDSCTVSLDRPATL